MRFSSSLVLVGAVLVGCEVDVIDPDDGGGPSTGGSAELGGAGQGADGQGGDGLGSEGGGGSAPTTHDVELTIDIPVVVDPDGAIVVVSEADGSLVSSYRGGELPKTVALTDGQLVSYLHRSGNSTSQPGMPEHIQYVHSYRVRPDVTRIESRAVPWPFEYCDLLEDMELTISIPDVPGNVSVHIGVGGFASVSGPEEVTFLVDACGGVETFDVLLIARDGEQVFSYEMIEAVPYLPGQTMQLAATIADTSTAPLAVHVTGVDAATSAFGHATWQGSGVIDLFEPSGQLLTPTLPGLDLPAFVPDGPFTYAPQIIDPPGGRPFVTAVVKGPPIGDSCETSSFSRRGASDETFEFDARRLALPALTGEGSWTFVEEGERGDGVFQYQRFANGNIDWHVHDDPHHDPIAATFPELPNELPAGVVAPVGPPDVVGISHVDDTEIASYAQRVSSSALPVEWTHTSRGTHACPIE